jgi:hypothetical protein
VVEEARRQVEMRRELDLQMRRGLEGQRGKLEDLWLNDNQV